MAILKPIKSLPFVQEEENIDTSLWSDEAKAEKAREWRDKELSNSDWIASIPDHGLHDSYMTYRQALRDWPTTEDFPDTKPTL